jgi:hypothetical protein
MKLGSRLRLTKYAVKSVALGYAPDPYWGARKFLKGWNESELALLSGFADQHRAAFDVGANFGMWSAAMLPHFGTVHAFEPIPRLAAVLRKGLAAACRFTRSQCRARQAVRNCGCPLPIWDAARSNRRTVSKVSGVIRTNRSSSSTYRRCGWTISRRPIRH